MRSVPIVPIGYEELLGPDITTSLNKSQILKKRSETTLRNWPHSDKKILVNL